MEGGGGGKGGCWKCTGCTGCRKKEEEGKEEEEEVTKPDGCTEKEILNLRPRCISKRVTTSVHKAWQYYP